MPPLLYQYAGLFQGVGKVLSPFSRNEPRTSVFLSFLDAKLIFFAGQWFFLIFYGIIIEGCLKFQLLDAFSAFGEYI
jgi:hypothetical protein